MGGVRHRWSLPELLYDFHFKLFPLLLYIILARMMGNGNPESLSIPFVIPGCVELLFAM